MKHKFDTLKSIIGNRKSQISSPTHSFTHPPIHLIMQNEPNLKPNAHIPASPNGSRATGHESRFIQNEPNFNRPIRRIWHDI